MRFLRQQVAVAKGARHIVAGLHDLGLRVYKKKKGKHVGIVLKVLVKEGPLGIHFLKKAILTNQGTYIMAILGTGILNNYRVEA